VLAVTSTQASPPISKPCSARLGGPVPDPIQPRGPVPTLGHKAGIKRQHMLVLCGHPLHKGSSMETHPIKLLGKPPTEGLFMIRTRATQIPECRPSRQQQQPPQEMTEKTAAHWAGIVQPGQSTYQWSHAWLFRG